MGAGCVSPRCVMRKCRAGALQTLRRRCWGVGGTTQARNYAPSGPPAAVRSPARLLRPCGAGPACAGAEPPLSALDRHWAHIWTGLERRCDSQPSPALTHPTVPKSPASPDPLARRKPPPGPCPASHSSIAPAAPPMVVAVASQLAFATAAAHRPVLQSSAVVAWRPSSRLAGAIGRQAGAGAVGCCSGSALAKEHTH